MSEFELKGTYGIEGFADAGAVLVEGFVLVGGEKLDLAGDGAVGRRLIGGCHVCVASRRAEGRRPGVISGPLLPPYAWTARRS
jgi:hypothetical protein